MPSSSSLPSAAANQLGSVNVVAASTSLPMAAGPNQPLPGPLGLPTEIHVMIFEYVPVEGGRLSPYDARHTGNEPILEIQPRRISRHTAPPKSRFLKPMVEILEVGLVAKPLIPVVREVFFGKNCFDLTYRQSWVRGIQRNLRVLIHNVEIELGDFCTTDPLLARIDLSREQLNIERLRISIHDRWFKSTSRSIDKKLERYLGSRSFALPLKFVHSAECVALRKSRSVSGLMSSRAIRQLHVGCWRRQLGSRIPWSKIRGMKAPGKIRTMHELQSGSISSFSMMP